VSDWIERLLDVLAAEQALYERLCDALRAERAALTALDVPQIEACVHEKEEISDEARLLEESRLALTEALAQQLGLAERQPKLARLCERLGDAEPRLREAHLRLGARLSLARELLEANRAVSASELANVQASLRALGATQVGAGYGARADVPDTGRIVRQTA
jgi:flagellar biosynthesis/type III secretory pathway chaperone